MVYLAVCAVGVVVMHRRSVPRVIGPAVNGYVGCSWGLSLLMGEVEIIWKRLHAIFSAVAPQALWCNTALWRHAEAPRFVPRDPYRQALTMRPSLKARPLVS